MKKIFAIALVLCLLVAIVACGGDEDNTEIADTTVSTSTTEAGGETTTEPEGETTTEAGGLPVEENNDTSFGEAMEGKKS